jgi:hypothetical protein
MAGRDRREFWGGDSGRSRKLYTAEDLVEGLTGSSGGGVAGMMPGFAAQIVRIPSQHFSIIILSNCDALPVLDLAHEITDTCYLFWAPPGYDATNTATRYPVA